MPIIETNTSSEALLVNWVELDQHSSQPGVFSVAHTEGYEGYFGLNDIIIGEQIYIKDPDGVYARKYKTTKMRRLSDELDPLSRRRGMLMPPWKEGPWRVTLISKDFCFGISLVRDAEIGYADLLVVPTVVEKAPPHG